MTTSADIHDVVWDEIKNIVDQVRPNNYNIMNCVKEAKYDVYRMVLYDFQFTNALINDRRIGIHYYIKDGMITIYEMANKNTDDKNYHISSPNCFKDLKIGLKEMLWNK